MPTGDDPAAFDGLVDDDFDLESRTDFLESQDTSMD